MKSRQPRHPHFFMIFSIQEQTENVFGKLQPGQKSPTNTRVMGPGGKQRRRL